MGPEISTLLIADTNKPSNDGSSFISVFCTRLGSALGRALQEGFECKLIKCRHQSKTASLAVPTLTMKTDRICLPAVWGLLSFFPGAGKWSGAWDNSP